jgi:neutral ceramidase
MNQPQLMAGTSVADITPPLDVGLLTSAVKGLYAPFEFVRLPLKARVLVLKPDSGPVAIVSLDLLLLNDSAVGGWDLFKKGISDAIPAERIIICCTHTHNAPESGALTGLYLASSYQDWLSDVKNKIREAINQAILSARACSVSIAVSRLDGYSLQRRIKTHAGIVLSDSVQPIAPELLDLPPFDRRVTSLHLKDCNGASIATVVHAVCHAVHEMCMPHVSSEFPGEMCNELELSPDNGTPLFLNGAAGDTNPPTVSMGPEYAHRFGVALAKTVQGGGDHLRLDSSVVTFSNCKIQLPIRPGSEVTNESDALARLSALRIGPLAILFLPGEPFVETALEIEESSPFGHTIVVAYSENSIGYVPTKQAFVQGGYETGPGKWSFLKEGAERVIIACALQLLGELYNQ